MEHRQVDPANLINLEGPPTNDQMGLDAIARLDYSLYEFLIHFMQGMCQQLMGQDEDTANRYIDFMDRVMTAGLMVPVIDIDQSSVQFLLWSFEQQKWIDPNSSSKANTFWLTQYINYMSSVN